MAKAAPLLSVPRFGARAAMICAAIFALVLVVFGQTLRHDFVNFDDEVYVYQNPHIIPGLTLGGIVWAFTHSHARNWHPLTTISHMLDCQLFGLNAGAHHATNVLLHGATAVVLFVLLRQMTNTTWPSAFASAAWAVHPLRVESVAWIAERKDVLSGIFFVLTLAAYHHFVRQRDARRYCLVLVSFAAGLMCKPMLVTLPLILVLLDYWPLRRLDSAAQPRRNKHARAAAAERPSLRQIFIEKLPLLLLSAASCAATVIAQSGPVGSLQPLPLSWRIGNAIVTPLIYLKQIVWPVGLAPFYPYPSGTVGSAQLLAAALALLLITAGAVRLRNQQPWLLVGWLWFLIMLLPVIGVVQVGMQARADRYTYLPQIGVYIAMTWSVVSATHRRFHRLILPATAAVALAATSYVTWLQTSHWRDSRALWTHTAAVTRDNEVAENNLGILLEHDGRLDDAISHYQRAVAIQNQRGQERYDLTLSIAENNLANAFVRKGDAAAAVAHYRRATELRPDYADAFYNLGTLLFQNRDVDEAITSFEKTIALRPDDAAAHGRLGDALRQKGADARALVEYEKAAQLEPHALWAQHSLAWLLATSLSESVRNGARAVQIARDALHLPNGENGATIRALAAGYAAAGQFPEAIAAAQAGLRIAAAQDDSASVQSLQSDLDLYRMNIPVREIAPSQ